MHSVVSRFHIDFGDRNFVAFVVSYASALYCFVFAEVNAGPFAMCETFLAPRGGALPATAAGYSDADTQQLRDTLRRFLDVRTPFFTFVFGSCY
jgi:hypothetical protein